MFHFYKEVIFYVIKRFSILSLSVLFVEALAAQPRFSIEDVEFHSDDVYLTTRVNNENADYDSTATETAQLLFDQLQYDNTILNVPLARSLNDIEKGRPVCVINKIKSQAREQRFLYSLPLNIFQTQRFYQHATLPPIPEQFLNDKGEVVNIAEVLRQYAHSSLIVAENYSYGDVLDAQIRQAEPNQIIKVSNTTFFSRFFTLFENQRSDFALIFPSALFGVYGTSVPIKLRDYPIAGNPRTVSGHVLCERSEFGKEVIEHVNDAIRALYKQPEFVSAHVKYLAENKKGEVRNVILAAIEKTKR